MTIDDAIAKYKEITNTDAVCPGHCNIPCEKCVQESEQLAGWLEELKELRNMTAGHLYAVAFNRGYLKAEKEVRNKAIDDFAENIRLYYSLKQEMGYVATTYEDLINYIFELSEQLKAGGENGKKKYIELS